MIWILPVSLALSPNTHYSNPSDTSLLSIPILWMATSFLSCKSQPKRHLIQENFLATWPLAKSQSHHLVLFYQKTHFVYLLIVFPKHPTHTLTHTQRESLSVLFSVVSSVPTKPNGDAPRSHYSSQDTLHFAFHHTAFCLSGSVYDHRL